MEAIDVEKEKKARIFETKSDLEKKNNDKLKFVRKRINLTISNFFGSAVLNVPLLATTSPATSFNLIINEKAILEESCEREGGGERGKTADRKQANAVTRTRKSIRYVFRQFSTPSHRSQGNFIVKTVAAFVPS